MQVEASVQDKVKLLNANPRQTLGSTIGIEFTVMSKDHVAGTMPVDERTKQPFGILHGGASVAFAESLASIGAWLNIDENLYNAVGLEINANHLKSVQDGVVYGDARPIHRGKTTHVWEIKITTKDGKPVCISRCTLAIVPKRS